MNKYEMIKDIRAIIDDRCEAELGQVHASSKGGKVTKTVDTSLIAEDICNENYRKVADDEIVIKKSEYEALLLEQKRLKEIVDRIPCGYVKIADDEIVIKKQQYEQLKKYNRDRKRLRLKWQQARQALEQERKSCRLIADDEIVESMKTYERARQETAREILKGLNNLCNDCNGCYWAEDVGIMLYDWLPEMANKYGIELE